MVTEEDWGMRRYVPVAVTVPLHVRLTAIRDSMEREKRRKVTFSEVIEMLLDAWEGK